MEREKMEKVGRRFEEKRVLRGRTLIKLIKNIYI
jgi:hypothetical protein